MSVMWLSVCWADIWLTAAQLTEGYVDVDGFALFTRVLSEQEEKTVTDTAVSASLAALPNI